MASGSRHDSARPATLDGDACMAAPWVNAPSDRERRPPPPAGGTRLRMRGSHAAGQAEVLLCDPAYAHGGGLLVVIDLASGAVLHIVPQL